MFCHRGSVWPLNGFDSAISSSSVTYDGRIELRAKVITRVKWQELVATVYLGTALLEISPNGLLITEMFSTFLSRFSLYLKER